MTYNNALMIWVVTRYWPVLCSTEEESEDEEEMKQSQELALKFTESDDYLDVRMLAPPLVAQGPSINE